MFYCSFSGNIPACPKALFVLFTGAAGLPGMKGDAGLPGLPGLQGRKGEPGFPGEPGRDGEPGLTGFPGADGTPGLPGQKGDQGTNLLIWKCVIISAVRTCIFCTPK